MGLNIADNLAFASPSATLSSALLTAPQVGAATSWARVSQATPAPFADLLNPRDTATDRLPTAPEDEARQAAQQLVATALVQPILDQMQNDPFRSDLFHGGQAEDAFTGQLNTQLADRIVKASRMPVVDAVYRSLTKNRQPKVNVQG